MTQRNETALPLDLRMEDQVTDDDAREAYYDDERNRWVPRCPFGDECSGCDATGYCAKGCESARARHMLEAGLTP